MSSERLAVAAIAPGNIHSFPLYLHQSWSNRFQQIRSQLNHRYGVNLFGLSLRQLVSSPVGGDFEEIVQRTNLSPPLNTRIRFLISDRPITRLPTGSDANKVILLIELTQTETVWTASDLNPSHTLIKCSAEELPDLLSDILCDFSYSNSAPANQEIRSVATHLGSLENFLAAKALVHEQFGSSPYASFSFVSRNNGNFGTDRHLNEFIENWDRFIIEQLSTFDRNRSIARKIAQVSPKFRDQLPRNRVNNAIDQLPVGTHILFVQQKSIEARTEKKFKNLFNSTFDQLDVAGGGRKRFGFFVNREMPLNASKLVRDGMAHAVRVHIGV